ncbi:unnamed protein product [Dibothriocephalus latus]|uniref:GAT domain-containing protein n=1 Tax=Dibothriocephalus latus TaxID=60516 RepID=A0A3P6S904_DIBLA|nr:unnamed protein product [Dibothriocephalus latus]
MNWPPEATTFETATVATAAADISAEFTAKPPLTEADDVPQTLIEASEVLWQFMTFQQDMSSSSAHMADPAWMRELQIIGERLMRLQQKVDRLINAKLDEISTDSTEEAEKSLANLMNVNDELLFCVEDYRRTTRKYEVSMPIHLHILSRPV